ncbi:MAG: ribonucleoside-diphosphate reductase, adenosylcobalamin-dependent [Candidatus Omnitrophica bacterium 4484_70.2]|nr:MAG: ribonucleoside-diphosphate reductase, adenosylcobalamin-dependent [Candidatus Omnitrophica bacterium 4484_70.2]
MEIKYVIKRDGKKEKFTPQKIFQAIFKAAVTFYSSRDAERISKEISKQVLKKLSSLKKKVIPIEEIQDKIEQTLMEMKRFKIAKAFILYRRYRQELRETKNILGVKDELKLSLNAITILRERYLLKDEKREIIETPQQMFLRVAQAVASSERNFNRKKENYFQEKFFKIMCNLEFLPNSPTLMNAQTSLGQLSACFVLPVEDSIEGIFKSLAAMAVIHKTGGGTGFSFSSLRPQGDIVSTTKGFASGPLSFMRIFDVATSVIIQGGRRRGANMAVLRVDHPDILDFVEAKLDKTSFSNFNFSVALTDRFMNALSKNEKIELINPRTGKKMREIKARELFLRICFSAYQCGDPGVIFLDRINRQHPLRGLGKIEATNPCGEVPLLPYEACNLGSINLAKFVKNKKVDWERLREVIKLGIRFLDNVIEVNKYPLGEIEKVTKRNRKIGLGVMGFADMLVKLRIPYNSHQAVGFAHRLMRFIRKISLEASQELAYERGVFSNWKFSVYRRKNLKLRNATLNSIAPTGSISIIADCSSGIEPFFSLTYIRKISEGLNLLEVNPLLEEVAREEGFYSKRLMKIIKGKVSLRKLKVPHLLKNIFVTAFDISWQNHLLIQAAFQRFTDNAVSKTINLSPQVSLKEIEKIYLTADRLSLKGVTVYRYGTYKKQVLSIEDIEEKERCLYFCPQ